MRKWWAIAAVATVVATAGPAAADWAPTAWGMTPAQVTTAMGGTAESLPGGGLRIEGARTVAGFTFDRVIFGFTGGKLSHVLFEGRLEMFDSLNAALASAYGQPVVVEDRPDQRRRVYVDRQKGNTLTLDAGRTTVILTYTPVAQGF